MVFISLFEQDFLRRILVRYFLNVPYCLSSLIYQLGLEALQNALAEYACRTERIVSHLINLD